MYGIYEGGKVIGTFAAPLTIKSNQPEFGSDSMSLRRSVQKRSGQRWEISAAIQPESSDANELAAYLIQKGHTSKINILMPQNVGARMKKQTGTPTLASGNANATSVSCSSSAVIPRGTFIKFGNHSKIYMTTATKTSGGNTLDIYPPLRVSVSNTPFTWQDDVIMTAYIEMDTTIGMVYSDGILMDMGTMKFVEDV